MPTAQSRQALARPWYADPQTRAAYEKGEYQGSEFYRWVTGEPAARELFAAQQQRLQGMSLAFDNDGLFPFGLPDGDGPELLARLVDHYADAGARFLAFGVGSCFAWTYTPRVMEAPWADDPAWSHLAWQQLRAYRQAGTDPLTLVLKRAGERRLPLHANFRFNRYHPNKQPPLTSSWFMAHPEYWLSRQSCPFWVEDAGFKWPQQWSINLAFPEVREHLARELVDVVEHYRVDALQLELQRAVPFFEIDEPHKQEHLTAFLRLLRTKRDAIGSSQGRQIGLALWLPQEAHMGRLRHTWPDRFFGDEVWGFDQPTWIREGLVDVLIADAYNADAVSFTPPMEGPVPVPSWVRLARGTRTTVLGCAMNLGWTPPEDLTPERCALKARAVETINRQYDGGFFFNTTPFELAEIFHVGGV